MILYLIYQSSSTLKSFTTVTVKAIVKLNSGHIDKFEKLAVVAHVLRQIWSFHIVLLQRTAKKCTTNYNTNAQLLFYSSLNLLFSDDAVAVAFVVFLRPWQTRAFHISYNVECWNTFKLQYGPCYSKTLFHIYDRSVDLT